MKTPIITAFLFAFAVPAMAQTPYGGYGTGSNPSTHENQGYTRQNGTVVQPYQQTNPNSTTSDNFNTRGNYNPNTGTYGTRSPR